MYHFVIIGLDYIFQLSILDKQGRNKPPCFIGVDARDVSIFLALEFEKLIMVVTFYTQALVCRLPENRRSVGPDRQKCSRTDDFKIYIGPNVR